VINVTKTFLPSLEAYNVYLAKMWQSGWVTNGGVFLNELEGRLRHVLGVKHVFVVANGTLAIQMAIRAARLEGDVVTTPFSYVATTSSLVWEGCRPVFADIDPRTLCIDARQVEKAITPTTSGILAVHVYGNPCAVVALKEIARRKNVALIYDAAHAFGVNYDGRSLLTYGDISTLSFHATKLFHTFEGGAVCTESDELADRIGRLRNFGHTSPATFDGVGINAKMSEAHAAMGLCVLPEVPRLIEQRAVLCQLYDKLLLGSPILSRPGLTEGTTHYNFAYYPVVFDSEERLLAVTKVLHENGIYPRRYFFPVLSSLNYVKSPAMPVSEDVARRVLCLPLYHDLDSGDVVKICELIRSV
jgi:dTDP-4-amino-4,6-dideoxygalactose transaminase